MRSPPPLSRFWLLNGGARHHRNKKKIYFAFDWNEWMAIQCEWQFRGCAPCWRDLFNWPENLKCENTKIKCAKEERERAREEQIGSNKVDTIFIHVRSVVRGRFTKCMCFVIFSLVCLCVASSLATRILVRVCHLECEKGAPSAKVG